ncbi:MAG TPA: GNAT family protein [Polyangiaceae bacterium]|jgi:RimJ/RimL family protein N-acetyltransferase|nr:GNAT family protein [Polyangiaceae bacterium]
MTTPLKLEKVSLEGDVVRLVPYEPSNFDEVANAALSAPEIFRYIPARMQTMDDMRDRFVPAERLMASGAGLFFLTRLKNTGELVGSTCTIVTDATHRRLEIGSTWLLPRAQRTGANTEAKLLQLTHAFETVGAMRVEFKTDARNERSRAALLRLGAKEEGTLRSHMLCWDGHRRDSVYFSILDTEWPAVKARLKAAP